MNGQTRVIFAGTPDFAAAALAAIVEAGFSVPLVLTQPDRPKGRGMKCQASPVKQLAEKLGLEVAQPDSLKTKEIQDFIAEKNADVMVVAAYGMLLPETVLRLPKHGCLNIHASLLPRWRGAAPIQRAIEAGDAKTGVCIMQMDAGLDTGGVVSRHEYEIRPDDTASDVHDALMRLGAAAIVADLQHLDGLQAVPQDDGAACYAKKLSKADAQLDWRLPAAVLERKIRAFNPVPGAWTLRHGKTLKILKAKVAAGHGRPGEVLHVDAQTWTVACGEQALSLLTVQAAGSKAMPVRDFLNGNSVAVGEILGGDAA